MTSRRMGRPVIPFDLSHADGVGPVMGRFA